ncbi:hypothetical protein [Ferruginibacter sp. SUN106]|uniref:hypothetical protein n=1 Tax=Ferruginibacter sp. SUN106 TaxID=2978348 RepID=UPI003D36CE02
MLLSIYKVLCYTGIALLISLGICEAALSTDNSGLNIDFNLGIGFDILITIVFIAMFTFFVLPLFYVRFRKQKIFIIILITGIVAMFLPALSFWENISRWFGPEHIDFSDVFKTSAFRKHISSIENIVAICIFICQLSVFILTFRIKRPGIRSLELTSS